MRRECGDANGEGNGNGSRARIVAEVARVGRARGAANQAWPHDAHWEAVRTEVADESLGHAFAEHVGVGQPGSLQVLFHLQEEKLLSGQSRQCGRLKEEQDSRPKRDTSRVAAAGERVNSSAESDSTVCGAPVMLLRPKFMG